MTLLATLCEALADARSVYLQAGAGEALVLRQILAERPDLLEGRTVTTVLLPGMNEHDLTAGAARARVEAFMLPAGWRGAFEAGRLRIRPLAYSQIATALETGPAPDLAIVQTTTPDASGALSPGPCADFAPIVWPRARRRLAILNARLPRLSSGPAFAAAEADWTIAAEGPFVTAPDDGAAGGALRVIAERIADLIEDGSALQTGIGGAPAQALFALTHKRDLRVRSGMVTPGYQALDAAGALDARSAQITGMALGPEPFMRWAAQRFTFADVRTTHGTRALAGVDRLHTVNSALEIDLLGQVNLEWRGGKLFSGLGGAPDFARAAAASPGGRAVLALPATAAGGAVSRIVPRLTSPTASLPRELTDTVVTEFGVAQILGEDLDARAERLIAIADPAHQPALRAAWRELRRAL